MKHYSTVLLTIHVLYEFWEVEELWDEFFDVGWTLHACLPGCCHRVELPVRTVKPIQQHVTRVTAQSQEM